MENDARDAADDSEPAVAWSAEDIANGARLFASLACIACHPLPGSPASDTDRVDLTSVRQKWNVGSIDRYIAAPSEIHPGTRMPTFPLTPSEVDSITAFINANSAPPVSPGRSVEPLPTAGRERGRALVETLGCLRCHPTSSPGIVDRSRFPTLESASRRAATATGCVAAESAIVGVPHWPFDAPVRRAMLDVLRHAPDSLRRDSPVETAERAMNLHRCQACHERDGNSASWALHRAEAIHLEAPIDPNITVELIPQLTHAGDKLHASWMETLLAGEQKPPLRPWLRTRMPSFPRIARIVADGIALEHGIDESADEPEIGSEAEPEPADVETGKRLASDSGGLSCVTCHSIGRVPARMRLHFGVVDLVQARSRLRREFYRRWMLSPQRIDPRTPMPQFADEDGRTALLDVLDGDANAQFHAIWAYLDAEIRTSSSATPR
jgi:mono/diheme cytochrome c family protein